MDVIRQSLGSLCDEFVLLREVAPEPVFQSSDDAAVDMSPADMSPADVSPDDSASQVGGYKAHSGSTAGSRASSRASSGAGASSASGSAAAPRSAAAHKSVTIRTQVDQMDDEGHTNRKHADEQ